MCEKCVSLGKEGDPVCVCICLKETKTSVHKGTSARLVCSGSQRGQIMPGRDRNTYSDAILTHIGQRMKSWFLSKTYTQIKSELGWEQLSFQCHLHCCLVTLSKKYA